MFFVDPDFTYFISPCYCRLFIFIFAITTAVTIINVLLLLNV